MSMKLVFPAVKSKMIASVDLNNPLAYFSSNSSILDFVLTLFFTTTVSNIFPKLNGVHGPGVWGRLLLQSGSFAFTDIGTRNRRGPLFDRVVEFVNQVRQEPTAVSERALA